MLSAIGAGIGLLIVGFLASLMLYVVLHGASTSQTQYPVWYVCILLTILPTLILSDAGLGSLPDLLLWCMGVLLGIWLAYLLHKPQPDLSYDVTGDPAMV